VDGNSSQPQFFCHPLIISTESALPFTPKFPFFPMVSLSCSKSADLAVAKEKPDESNLTITGMAGDTPEKQSGTDPLGHAASFFSGGHSGGPTLKWLRWRKTRDEVFGVDMEPWHDGWAMELIFGQRACELQRNLWQLLCKGKHYQAGQGVLSIPGDWKRRVRAKQREKALVKRRAQLNNDRCKTLEGRPYASLRPGPRFGNGFLCSQASEKAYHCVDPEFGIGFCDLKRLRKPFHFGIQFLG